MIEQPIFLVGAERSGTTLLRLMLDHHPQIAFHFEFEFAVKYLGPRGELPDLAAYHAALEVDRVFQMSGARIDPALSYAELIDSFLQQKRALDAKPLIGATVHRRFELLPRFWPKAKYIHLLRDGRDVARSGMRMGWAGNLWCAAPRWLEAEQSWDRLCAQLEPAQMHELRYEDLASDARGALEPLCAFLGVEFDPAMFDYVQSSHYGPPDPGLVSQWRRKLAPHELQQIEARIGEMLERRGYSPSGHPRRAPGWLHRRALELHSRAVRAQLRQQRYGAPLFLSELIARRMGLCRWHRALRRQIHAIDNQHLR